MIKSSVMGAVVLMLAGAVQAAVPINWQSSGALSSGVSEVETEGVQEYAYNLGDGTTYTVNGVSFKGTASGAVGDLAGDGNVLWGPTDNGSNAGFSNLSDSLGNLMDSAQWGLGNTETTITLKNLIEGTNYLVQVFSSDTRGTRNNTLVLDSGTLNTFSSVETGSGNSGAQVTGTFTADASGEASFTFRYLATSGNANINAIQVRDLDGTLPPSTDLFVHPGIGLTVNSLNSIKANLNVEPWKTGYEDMLSASQSSLNYTPYQDGTLTEVGRLVNNKAWESDMEAIHNMARLWYFTGDEAYAQKGRDILISWANTHTNWLETPNTYLVQGYHAWQVFEGADILRGTWPGWTDEDTETCKTYFENVCWKGSMTSVPHPLKSANQGMAQFAPALGIAIFNDDQEKFDQCLQAFRADAAAALGNTLPNGQVGDSGRDAHDQGQLMLMAWAAEVFWNQGVDVYSEFDNRLLAAVEYVSRYNLLLDTPFIQAGTVYDVYPEAHSLEGEYANYAIETKMLTSLYSAYVTRQGMRSPYLEKYMTYTTQNADSFCYLLPADTSTATLADPIVGPAEVSSVTSLSQANIGNCTTGSASYNSGSKTWTVTGRGSRLSDSSADYRFAYLPVTGDATIIAKLTSLSGNDSNARAGVVITETLSDSSKRQAMIISNPTGDDEMYSFWVDAEAASHKPDGGSGTRTYNTMPDNKVPYWIKIERIGNRINSFSSPDGANWSCGESADYDMGSTAYIGLAVSSDSYSSTATATFTDVRMTGGDGGEASDVPLAPYAIYASPGGDQNPIRWLESFEADSYKIWRTTTPGGPYTLITEQTGTSFIDTNVLFGAHYYYAVSAVNGIGESALSTESTFEYADTDYYEAEDYDAQSGVRTEGCRDFFGGENLGYLNEGDWCRYDDITLRAGAVFKARCAGYNDGLGQIEVRLDSTSGTLIGVIDPIYTDGTQYWATSETNLTDTVGTHDLYLVFTEGTNSSPGFNLNWFDITYPQITEVDLGMDTTITLDPATHELTNLGGITAWDSTSTHLKLADGSDLSKLDFPMFGITSWATTNFSDLAKATIWDGVNLSGITLITDGNFGAGDSFVGADFSGVVWGESATTADAAKFFSEGSGATSAATKDDAITFVGADLSQISGAARTVMINNLGGFDGTTPIGAKFDPDFITNSGWSSTALLAAGWQYSAIDAYSIIEAEDYDVQSGIGTQPCSEGGLNIKDIHDGDYCAYYDVDFGSGANGFQARVASLNSGGSIEVHLDSPTGPLVGTCVVTGTSSWQNWVTKTTTITGACGVHDVYLVFKGGSGYLFNVNWFTFIDSNPPAVPTGLVATAGDGLVNVNWADNGESDLADYSIYRSTTMGSYGTPLATGIAQSDYVDNAVVNGTMYYYVVTAVDAQSNESTASNEDSSTPLSPTVPAEIGSEMTFSNGYLNIQFTGTVGQHYRVESTEDLTDTNAWQTVTDIVSLATSPFAIWTPATNSVEFYRVIGNP